MSPEAGSKPVVDAPTSHDGRYRVLVVTSDSHVSEAVEAELGRRAEGREVDVKVIAPAFAKNAFGHAMGNVDGAIVDAGERLEQTRSELEEADAEMEIETAVGDSDPVLAIEDALHDFAADEILLVTHDEEHALWLEDDLFERARRKFNLPIVHFEVAAGSGTATEEVERSDEGADPARDAEFEPDSKNLPGLSVRDMVGLGVAVAGSLLLIVLAASNFTAGRAIVAGVVTLINMAHIVGLMLFESVGYRGGWERGFANLSVGMTIAAIPISLLLGGEDSV